MTLECELCFRICQQDCDLLTLPCGFVICFDHLNQGQEQFECPICHNHQVDKNSCLSMNKNKMKLKQREYYQNVDKLKHKLDDFDSMQHVLNIEPYFDNLIKKVHSKRDELTSLFKDKIFHHADQLTQQIISAKTDKESDLKNLIQSLDRPHFEDLLMDKFEKKIRLEDNTNHFEAKSSILISKINQLSDKMVEITNLAESIKKFDLIKTSNDVNINLSKYFGDLNFSSKKFHLNNLKLDKKIEIGQDFIWSCDEFKSGELAVITEDETIKLVDTQDPVVIQTVKHRPEWNVIGKKQIRVNNENKIVTFIKDELLLYDKKGTSTKFKIDCPGFICFVELCEYTNQIITGHECGNIKVWSESEGNFVCKFTYRDKKKINFLKMFDQNRLLIADKSSSIKVLYLSNGKIYNFREHYRNATLLERVSSKEFVSYARDDFVRIWNIDTRRCLRFFKNSSGFITSIQKIDDTRFLSCTNIGFVHVWNKDSLKWEEELKVNGCGIVLFSKVLSNGCLICCYSKGSIYIWK